jgi:hypothetical protein
MLEQVSTSVKFLAFFTASKQGKTGLTVTVDIYNPSGTQIVTAGSATALGGGLYSYTLSSNNSSEGEYAAIFKTTDSTVDAQHIPSLWVLGRAGVENLDATTSSRLASSGYTAPANSDISAIKAKTDNLPASPAATADIPTAAISAIQAKTDNLPSDPADQSLVESAISALSIPSAVQIRTEMDSNSTKLANLDATISSRSTLTTGDLPSVPSAASVATAVRTELTEISNLDASISSRLASASYTAPSNSDISAIKSKTDNLPASPAAVSDIPTTAQIATAVEGSLLNENDGQAVLNALVGAIGNQNLSEVSLVAAIRSDLERTGGKIDSLPTAAAPSAASVATAVWSAASREITGGVVDTLTNSPDVPTEAEIASQVRTELAVELGRIDAAISSRLAPSGTLATVTTLTNAPTVPTAAAIADEVRVELATELARLDAPVSGATAPSAATVATAVRSELSVELARVDQAVSSRLAGSAYTAPANSDVAAVKAVTDALVVERLNNCATTAIVGNLIAQANS